jgi:hypothetical protein
MVLVLVATIAMLGLAAASARDAAAASGLSFSAGSTPAPRIFAGLGQAVTFRARWRGPKPFRSRARIVIRYTKSNAAGTKTIGPVNPRRRTCRRGVRRCAWPREVLRAAGTRGYQAVVELNGRIIARSRTVTARWRPRGTKPPTPTPTPTTPTPVTTVTPVTPAAQSTPTAVGVPATSGATSGPLAFALPTSIATGAESHSVVAHDLDGDGDQDLATAVAISSAIAVSLNNGSGTFSAPAFYATGAYPKYASVGDVNGDGRADLVSANQNHDSITVLKGNGNGTFQPGISYTVCAAPHEAAFGDLNGDGKQDVAVACFGASNVLSVLLNSGDSAGALGAKTDYPTAAGGRSLVLRDFNGDGDLDIAEAAFDSGQVAVLSNNGGGVFGTATLHAYSSPHNISSADLNGDGEFDLVVTSEHTDSVGVMLANGDGTFQNPVSYIVGDAPKATSIGDLDGDGTLDLATANSHGNYPDGSTPTTLTILLGNGDGTFSTGTTLAAPLTPFSVTIADFNGDAKNDLATANWHSGDVKVFGHAP